MIKEKCFTEEWLDSFKKQPEHKKIDKIILEKMIYALHLLEQLKVNGLNFTFKGGTSLILLLDEGHRFSIDIDIICNLKREELEIVLKKVIESSRFNSFELDEHRSYNEGVPKAHYSFSFNSSTKGKYPGTIILDVLIENPIYPETTKKAISAKWIETEERTEVLVPTINAIIGDKLTAFAPNTIGIPYSKGGQSITMEICKQLFDLSKLFNKILSMEVVKNSFITFAKKEIEYRKKTHPNISVDQVLRDTINTCLIIAKRGSDTANEKSKFILIQKGIIAFGTGYLMSGKFRIDDAINASAKVVYLAAKILVNDLTPIEYYNGQNIKYLNIENPDWNFLNKLKRQPDKSTFYYWYNTIILLTREEE